MKIDIPIFKKLKKISPNGLYTRSLIIIIAPIVVLQAILTFVFLESPNEQNLSNRRTKMQLILVFEINKNNA